MSLRCRVASLAVLGLGTTGATIGVIAPVTAGAATVVQVGNGVGVTPAPGWVSQRSNANTVTFSHRKPLGEFVVLAAGNVAGTVTQAASLHLNEFVQGNGLRALKASTAQQASVPGPTFDQVATISYTVKSGSTKLVGIAVEYQNSKTGNGAFAIVVANPRDKPALKRGVNSMFSSIISDT